MRNYNSKVSQKLTYTPSEAAGLLGIGRTKAYELIRSGDLPSIRLGRRILVPLAALEDWLRDNLQGKGKEKTENGEEKA